MFAAAAMVRTLQCVAFGGVWCSVMLHHLLDLLRRQRLAPWWPRGVLQKAVHPLCRHSAGASGAP